MIDAGKHPPQWRCSRCFRCFSYSIDQTQLGAQGRFTAHGRLMPRLRCVRRDSDPTRRRALPAVRCSGSKFKRIAPYEASKRHERWFSIIRLSPNLMGITTSMTLFFSSVPRYDRQTYAGVIASNPDTNTTEIRKTSNVSSVPEKGGPLRLYSIPPAPKRRRCRRDLAPTSGTSISGLA